MLQQNLSVTHYVHGMGHFATLNAAKHFFIEDGMVLWICNLLQICSHYLPSVKA
jgi:hypothetical protein